MAYMSQKQKKEIAVLLKKEFGTSVKKRGFSYSLGVRHHSTIVMKIKSGTVDFIGNYIDTADDHRLAEWRRSNIDPIKEIKSLSVNEHNIETSFSGKVKDILLRIRKCLNKDNFDKSDIMTDYFHVGHYISIDVGQWDKPYKCYPK